MGHSPNKQNTIVLPPLPQADHYLLAFSGGSDSVALLHCLIQQKAIKNKLSAVHVNHQIHHDAAQWAVQCQQTCHQWNVPCSVKTIQCDKSDENSLRISRYSAFSQHLEQLPDNTVLLTAHHLNDDVETIVFRLLRGTGLNGLTGMGECGHFHGITIFRPLINIPKTVINHYLAFHKLDWVEDSSNLDTNYDRNYIRHKIIPIFEQFRPDAVYRIQDSRDNLMASLALLEHLIGDVNPLPLDYNLSTEHLAATLYHWLGIKCLNPPHRKQLLSFAEACLTADSDKLPLLKTDAYLLITWQQGVYALRPNLLAINTDQCHQLVIKSDDFHWQHEFGRLSIQAKQAIDITIKLRFNQPGESIQLPGKAHHQRIKEILREKQVPPWQRKRLPFLYHHNQLLAVGSIISHEGQQWFAKHEIEYDWQSTDFFL